MRVLVTGANGFVGNAICRDLLKNSHNVFKIVNQKFNVPLEQNPDRSFQTYSCDITDEKSISKIYEIGSIDVIVHCAGLAHQFQEVDNTKFWNVNVEGTRNICSLSSRLKPKHFIQISSVSVYGNVDEIYKEFPINENDICDPKDIYGKSKLEAENVCRKFFEKTQTKLTILRLATVIGEGDKGNVLRLIKLIDKKRFIWIGEGKNRKSLIYVTDVSKAVNELLSCTISETEIFNVTAKDIEMSEIVKVISQCLEKKVPTIKLPDKFLNKTFRFLYKITKIKKFQGLSKSLEKWVSNDIYSGELFFQRYGFIPTVTIEKALEKEIVWYLEQQ